MELPRAGAAQQRFRLRPMRPENKRDKTTGKAGQEAPEETAPDAAQAPEAEAPEPSAAVDEQAAPAAQDAPPEQTAGVTRAEVQEDAETRLTRELEEARQLAEENYEKYVRFQAEFENYKKRTQKEHAENSKYSQLPLLRDLIGILDNLERAVEHAKSAPEEGVDGILAGVEMVAKQLNETFEKHGMQRIKSVGEPFDPTRHEAMGVVETVDAPENQVMEEYQAGYILHDRVVKPAMVTVSKQGQGGAAAEPAPGKEQNQQDETQQD